MGLWDWTDEPYLAFGSGAANNGFAPRAASGGSALLRLLQQAAAGGQFYGDDPSAGTSASPSASQAVRGASQIPEQLARFAWPDPQNGPPRWPSPSNPASPMSAPLSPASATSDDARAAQAAPQAGAGRLVGVVQRKGNQPDVRRSAALERLDDAADAQAAREAWASRMKEAARPARGHRNEGAATQWLDDHWPEIMLAPFMAPEAVMLRALGGAGRAAAAAGARRGAASAMEEANGYHLVGGADGTIFKNGGESVKNLTPRPQDNGVLSFRDSLSNPYPLRPGQKPVFPYGGPYRRFDTSKFPPDSVIYDNNPPGHVGVRGVSVEELINAIVGKGNLKPGGFPK